MDGGRAGIPGRDIGDAGRDVEALVKGHGRCSCPADGESGLQHQDGGE
jgi:hypothetical protein